MFCSFCTYSENHNGMGNLYQAYVLKKKRVFYHIDCVQWSAGMIRKKLSDRDEYVTRLFDISKKKTCYICGLACPTIKVLKHGVQYYYHYICAKDAGISVNQERLIGYINFAVSSSVGVSTKKKLASVKNERMNNRKKEVEQPQKRKLENSLHNETPNKRISPNDTLIISSPNGYSVSPSLQHLSHSPAFLALPPSEKYSDSSSNSNNNNNNNNNNDLLSVYPNSLFATDDYEITSPYLSEKPKTITPPDDFLLDSNPYYTRTKVLSKLISSSSSSPLSSSDSENNKNNIIISSKLVKKNRSINDNGLLSSVSSSSSSNSSSSFSLDEKKRKEKQSHYIDNNHFTIKEDKDNNNNNNNISTILDFQDVMNGKNVTNITKYNMHIEERDILRVRITRKEKLISEGVFICVYGPSYFMDNLRSNEPMEIPIERGLPEEEFIDIFNNLYLSQVNLIQLSVTNYSTSCPLKILFTKLIQKNLVGYLDFNEYELFIVPHGLHLLKYGSFNFLIDRYMRNGPVIPAWVILVSKVNGLFSPPSAINSNLSGSSVRNN